MRMFKLKERGFSVIELIVAIIIVLVMTAIIGTRYRHYKDDLDLRRVTREALADIRQAKAETKRTKQRHRVTFERHGYVVENIDQGNTIPSLSKKFCQTLGNTDVSLRWTLSAITFDTTPLRLGWIEEGQGNTITITHSNPKIDTNAIIISRLGRIEVLR